MMFISGSFSTSSKNNNINNYFLKSFCLSKNKKLFRSEMKERYYANCININIYCSWQRTKKRLFLSSKSSSI